MHSMRFGPCGVYQTDDFSGVARVLILDCLICCAGGGMGRRGKEEEAGEEGASERKEEKQTCWRKRGL
jgi:hypothetical protein